VNTRERTHNYGPQTGNSEPTAWPPLLARTSCQHLRDHFASRDIKKVILDLCSGQRPCYDLDKRRESGERANRCGHQLVVFPTYVDLVSPRARSPRISPEARRRKGGRRLMGPGGRRYEVGMPAIAAAGGSAGTGWIGWTGGGVRRIRRAVNRTSSGSECRAPPKPYPLRAAEPIAPLYPGGIPGLSQILGDAGGGEEVGFSRGDLVSSETETRCEAWRWSAPTP